jgi:hypothetical protein
LLRFASVPADERELEGGAAHSTWDCWLAASGLNEAVVLCPALARAVERVVAEAESCMVLEKGKEGEAGEGSVGIIDVGDATEGDGGGGMLDR